ncbi:adenylate isopentenyltransferase 1 chloroplastic, partial [Phtheirospermum japonicum]
DITSNKTPPPDRKNIPHHLLGEFHPTESHPEFTAADFRSAASATISQIVSHRKIPFLVGGSNLYVYALLAKKFSHDAAASVFDRSKPEPDPAPFFKEFRYNYCFIWIDVSPPVLNEYLGKRVDEMMDPGMLEETGRVGQVIRQRRAGLGERVQAEQGDRRAGVREVFREVRRR